MSERITAFFGRNKKIFIGISTVFVLFFLDLDISFADGTEVDKSAGEEAVEIVNALIKVIAGIMGIMTAFVSLFLQPTWVNGTFIDLDKYMKEIWILCSNVVYIIFAFLLIFIAFANIIGKGGDKFGLKQALPKFIVGILIVPTSWFVVQFMISLAGVLTVAALSLPYETFKDRAEEFPVFSILSEDEDSQPLAEAKVCVKYVVNFGETPKLADGNGPSETRAIEEAINKGPIYCKDDGYVKMIDILQGKTFIGDDGEAQESIYSIISLYTFGILGLESLDNIEAKTVADGAVTNMVSFLTKNVLSLIFLLVYFILLLALFFALFIRILRIWIYIMLSPFFGLVYFFGKSGEGALAKFNFKEFLSLVMVPVYVSLALSFGFMFMLVAGNGLSEKANITPDTEVAPIKLGIIEIEIKGAVNKAGDKEENLLGVALRSFRGLGGALGEIIVLLFGIGMFWIAVMAALKSSEITKAAVQPIESFGNQIGKLAASAPMYAPIIPTGKGQTTSIAGIGNLSGRLMSQAKNIKVDQGERLGKRFGLLNDDSHISNASEKASNNIKDSRLAVGTEDHAKELSSAIYSAKSMEDASVNTKLLELINDTLKEMGKDPVNRGDKRALADAYKDIGLYNREKHSYKIFNIENLDQVANGDFTAFNKELDRGRESNSGNDNQGTTKIIYSDIKLDSSTGTIENNVLARDVAVDMATRVSTEEELLKEVQKRFALDITKAQKVVDQIIDIKDEDSKFILLKERNPS